MGKKNLSQIPQTRSTASLLDRRLLESCFLSQQVDKRARVAPEDPEYKRKIENRHVLDRQYEAELPTNWPKISAK